MFDEADATKWYIEAANNDVATAQLEAGLRYQQGLGIKQDLNESAKYLKLAALNDITLAKYLYGEQLLIGAGVDKHEADAAKYIIDAAHAGNIEAQLSAANLYEFGIGVPENLHIAVDYLQLAAAQKEASALFKLGQFFEKGLLGKADDTQAKRNYRQAAELGHIAAKFNLGVILNKQAETDVQKIVAPNFLNKRPMRVTPNLPTYGPLFESGYFVEKNEELAAQFFERAASDGKAEAQLKTALLYKHGIGVVQDLTAATSFHKAALRGNATAQFHYGTALANAAGIDLDIRNSIEWLKAAQQNHPDASFELSSFMQTRRSLIFMTRVCLTITWLKQPPWAAKCSIRERAKNSIKPQIWKISSHL